jgi:LmbE family N-acetylglucosaminyl deacetylase
MSALLKRLVSYAVGRRRLAGLRALLKTAAIHGESISVCQPEGGSVVVLAPHMDDEVLGCGGTLARHVQAGASVAVIFLTDGRYGSRANAALPDSERERAERALMDLRKQEARQAAGILGVGDITFLDEEDGRLRADPRVCLQLRQLLEQRQPDIVYLPFFLDNHRDHRATSSVLLSATAGTGLDFQCRGYEVWTPLFPNLVVEIDATIELKKSALACYASQLADMDYVHTGIGLSAFRSSATGGRTARFVEAFYGLRLEEFRRFHRAMKRFL